MRKDSLRAYRYKIIAFISGFALLVYELAASRILAPTIGSSLYVWTSVIGVIIAALSVGYFLGGWLADRRARQSDLKSLLILAVIGIISTLILAEPLLAQLSTQPIDGRFKGLFASLVLFMPTSIALGMLNPYLAKLHTVSLEHTGRSIASLSALNAVGSITGTFLAGFIFFGYLGSRATMLLLVLLLISTSFLVIEKRQLLRYFGISALLIIIALSVAPEFTGSEVRAIIDTPTANYRISEVEFNGRTVRVLTMGPGGYQSGIYVNGSDELVFPYTKALARGVALHESPDRLLILGGGAFTLPKYLAAKYPEAQVDVVEIDPQLEEISKEYFNYSDPPNVQTFAEDGRAFLNQTNEKYDVIIADAYSDTGIPFTFTTTEFASETKQALKPNGIVMANTIAGDNPPCRPVLRSIHNSFMQQFTYGTATPLSAPISERRQNIILSYTEDNQAWNQKYGGKMLSTKGALTLTDNHAPIERIHQNCLNS